MRLTLCGSRDYHLNVECFMLVLICSVSIFCVFLFVVRNDLRTLMVSTGVPCIEEIVCSMSAKITQFSVGLDK